MKNSRSPNFSNGKYQNSSFTPVMGEGYSWWRILGRQLRKPKDVIPLKPLPSVLTNLKSLHYERPAIIWFGHSSYLIHCNGINILVDPVFSGYASPIKGTVAAFKGADGYKAKEMPPIDLMIITHNHYDHLDSETLKQLLPSTKLVYTALDVGKDILRCAKEADVAITEMDWWDEKNITEDIILTATPARHFSGRGLVRGGSLWAAFVLDLFGHKIFIGGDSGYDTHFKQIGDKYGPMDIAILECGQYNEAWPYIHMMPEECVQASIDLKAKLLLPVHWAEFALSLHSWNEPIKRIVACAKEREVVITTPKIGEPVVLDSDYPVGAWW